MARDEIITSVHNPRVKAAVRLRDARERRETGRFLIDGVRELRRAVEAGVELVEIFACPALSSGDDSRSLVDRLRSSGAALVETTPAVFEKLAYGDRTEGVVAVARAPTRTLADLALPDDALVAVLEGLEKPGNFGAVLRSADGAGVAAAIVASGRTDLYNPNAIRASLGAIFALPVCAAPTVEVIAWLRERKYRVFAARVDGAIDYTQADYRGRAAIVLGSEATGLGDAWSVPDVTSVKLPMRGAVDSLNVSAAAAVLFYEALRQRCDSRIR